MLNPTEHAHNCFKTAVKTALADPETPAEILDVNNQHQGMTIAEWRHILTRVGEQALNEMTQRKCQNCMAGWAVNLSC
jgi:hypothetical protein